jgi:hypothetical protein
MGEHQQLLTIPCLKVRRNTTVWVGGIVRQPERGLLQLPAAP